ncbi:unnamed protein product [Rhodiola kirilowii]
MDRKLDKFLANLWKQHLHENSPR